MHGCDFSNLCCIEMDLGVVCIGMGVCMCTTVYIDVQPVFTYKLVLVSLWAN